MDFKQIQELIKIVNKSNIGELTIEQKDFRVTIKQKEEQVHQIMSSPAQSAPVQMPATQSSEIQPAGSSVSDKQKFQENAPSNTLTIKSPMIGTFYRKSSPD